jgi:hypothetical protein
MFGWVMNWLERRRRTRTRLIYRYWNGVAWRHGDPFSIWRGILNNPKIDVLESLGDVDQGIEPITGQVLSVVSEAFGLVRWDEARRTGLTDMEVVQVLLGLSEYLSRIKKNGSPGPTLPEPTGSMSSISLVPQGDVGRGCLGCGSAPDGQSAGGPGTFSGGSETPAAS